MNCPKCGAKLDDDALFCETCGTVVKWQNTAESSSAHIEEIQEPEELYISNSKSTGVKTKETYGMDKNTSTKGFSIWCFLSICSLGCSFFTLYKGIDRLTNYYNSDYSILNKNAYVGGDAYNYIINGTHATAFFVLTAMFVLAAIGLMILHYISRQTVAIIDPTEKRTMIEDIESNLPEI